MFEEEVITTNEPNKILGKTFFWMFLGLLGSGIIAWYTYSTDLLSTILNNDYFPILLVAELAIVLLFSFLFRKLPPMAVGILYFVYAMINGVTLATIFYIFELSSIVYIFGISALIFAILGFIGYTTKINLSKFGPYLTLFLIAGLIMSLLNIFIFNSSALSLGVDWFILLVFFGITVYDLNKIKLLSQDPNLDSEKIHIYCAMQLYLDFINIFIRILSIFGKRK